MGLSASKVGKTGKHISEEHFHEESVPTTPILASRIEKIRDDLDPRSPSANISRTPLQILSAAANRLQNFEENELNIVSNETPIRTKQFELGIDPRSPTTDFTRTPIILNANEKDLHKMLHNKNLDKARLANMSIISKTEETPKRSSQTKSPILLDSTPIKYRPDTCKRKSYVGLLETNIDFTETDLDVVQTKSIIIPEKNNSSLEESNEHNDKNLDGLKVNMTEHKELSNEQVGSEDQTHNEKISDHNILGTIDSSIIGCDQIDIKKDSPEDKNSESEEIENLGHVSMKIMDSQEKELDNVDANLIEANELIVEITDESKSAPASPLSPILASKETKSAPVSPPVVNITATVKELDQKLTNLIYEDDIVVCPRIVKLKEPIERSPLKNCNGNEPFRLQKLKVSDKPRKSEYAVSKIPIFKENGKREIQCENTPPRKLDTRKGKLNKCNWDNTDTTLYL